jgi:hypothetical protein
LGQVDSYKEIYNNYRDMVQIFIIYIREAHAIDSRRPVKYAKEMGIKNHTNYKERCSVANRFVKDKEMAVPILVDNMDNEVDKAYNGKPTRVFLIRKDGKLGVAGSRGPRGLKPALKEAKDWLKKYKETGKEPPITTTEEGSPARYNPVVENDKFCILGQAPVLKRQKKIVSGTKEKTG